jgi:hypothetical protein
MSEFADQPGFDYETEIVRRLAEDQDRVYAEEIYKKLMMERSPSRDSQPEESKALNEGQAYLENFEVPVPVPDLDRGISENSWTGLTDEEQMMNEVIFKSLQDK